MTQKERMKAGLVYNCSDPEISAEQNACIGKQNEYNRLGPQDAEKRSELLKEMFGAIGKNCYIEPPFHANWSGKHVFFGDDVYANFNLTLVDDGNIYIGDKTMIGPNVTISTAGHPVLPELRERSMQFNKDVHIGRNVWIGAGAVILPGITIGDNSVIGAGSIVTKDIPSGVVAVGSPCRVMRPIGEKDREFFYKDEKIDWENL